MTLWPTVRTQSLWQIAVALCLAPIAFSQPRADPVLISTASISYPPLARQARIQGDVRLEFFVNHNGQVVSVNVMSGHPLLAPLAVDAVQHWKFRLDPKSAQNDQRFETLFSFVISTDPVEETRGSNAKIVMDSFRQVTVTTYFDWIQKSDCPTGIPSPPSEIKDGDFVEMSGSGCMGTCPIYTVRIWSNGLVQWDGRGYVSKKSKESTNIGADSALALIQRFQTPEFWKLCGGYASSTTDSSTTTFRVRLGGRSKSVADYAGSAPKWVAELGPAIDEAANTHQWRHGDPREEPLSRIDEDSYLSKPGVTPLMRAAARADVGKVKVLLRQGADVAQGDSSGWTALMYSTISGYSDGGVRGEPGK